MGTGKNVKVSLKKIGDDMWQDMGECHIDGLEIDRCIAYEYKYGNGSFTTELTIDRDKLLLMYLAHDIRTLRRTGLYQRKSIPAMLTVKQYKLFNSASHRAGNCNIRRYLAKLGLKKVNVIVLRNERYDNRKEI